MAEKLDKLVSLLCKSLRARDGSWELRPSYKGNVRVENFVKKAVRLERTKDYVKLFNGDNEIALDQTSQNLLDISIDIYLDKDNSLSNLLSECLENL